VSSEKAAGRAPGDGEIMKDKQLEISKEKQKLFSRIKRLGGQIGAVERAVTDGDECADILMLLAAIRGGVNSLMAEILEDHIRLHITHPGRGPDSPEELTEDLISLVRAYLK
jgi:DNA-binding FrmR family transcriptional regulator